MMRAATVAFFALVLAAAVVRADATAADAAVPALSTQQEQALARMNPAGKKCHNYTGTCLDHGFVCANNEVVPHSQRCNGVEDCADGTDEFMCHHEDDTPLHLRPAEDRHASQQASCIWCTCTASVHTVVRGQPWWDYALHAPTDFLGLMTGTGPYAGRPCATDCVFTIRMGFYRKTGVCRGWLCCARQRECTVCYHLGGCSGKSPSQRCYA